MSDAYTAPAVTLHLRSETKKLEHRSALSPSIVQKLRENGFKVIVERSPERIFEDSEFGGADDELVDEGSWTNAPKDRIIIGLKELEDKDPFPLVHTHIQFSHCYKDQDGWQNVLSRFPRGGGTLYDLEFLQDDQGRRVAAFGYHAGYAGAALALLTYTWQLEHGRDEPLPGKSHYQFKDDLDKEVKTEVSRATQRSGKQPRIFIMGAKGRCGRGAIDMCKIAGIPDENLLRWDIEETSKKTGPYEEIRESDIFINCIYLNKKIPPFIDIDFLKKPHGNRNLQVVSDVSCDTTNPNNPIPFVNQATYFNEPTITVDGFSPPLSYIAIDHLPSLLPREASEAFSEALLPSLLQLPDRLTAPVWVGAEKLFEEKVALLPESLRQKPEPALNGAVKT